MKRAKIGKFVAMLGSDSEGEALAALKALKAELARHKMSMTDVANLIGEERAPSGDDEPRFHNDMSDEEVEIFRKKMERHRKRFKFEDHYNDRGLSCPRRHSEAVYILIDDHAISDREVGRRVGLSPTVIGRLRNIIGCEDAARIVRRQRGGVVQEYVMKAKGKG